MQWHMVVLFGTFKQLRVIFYCILNFCTACCIWLTKMCNTYVQLWYSLWCVYAKFFSVIEISLIFVFFLPFFRLFSILLWDLEPAPVTLIYVAIFYKLLSIIDFFLLLPLYILLCSSSVRCEMLQWINCNLYFIAALVSFALK